jgi:hypothetical protein
MNPKTIRLTGDFVDFKRNWQGDGSNLTAEIGGTTAKGTFTKVELKLSFDCLAYIMPGVKKAWEQEKQIRLDSITSIDNALGL